MVAGELNNPELEKVVEHINKGEKIIFLSGKAGTGKSTFLNTIDSYIKKVMVKVAPTGIAAHNIGATTIHSLFQIKPGVYVPDDKRLRQNAPKDDSDQSSIYDHFRYQENRVELFKKLELLIIDEISMVRCDIIDVIDKILRVFRNRLNEPFGGVQILMVGDLFQLPPIAQYGESQILEKFYASKYFFNARVFNQHEPILVELDIVYRQKDNLQYLELLNRIRTNEISENDIKYLNKKFNPTFTPTPNEKFITLCTHNDSARLVNLTKLSLLTTPSFVLNASINGLFDEKDFPVEKHLELKVGAQVMFAKNNAFKGYYNGQMGIINSISDIGLVVVTENNNQILVEIEEWKNINYSWDKKGKKVKEELLGTFKQYPIRLSWAITVHKSQGMTFDHVYADLSSAFDVGMVYVALSRCRDDKGLVLKSPIYRHSIQVDRKIVDYYTKIRNNTLIVVGEKGYKVVEQGVIEQLGETKSYWIKIIKEENGEKYWASLDTNTKTEVNTFLEIPECIPIRWRRYDEGVEFMVLSSVLEVEEEPPYYHLTPRCICTLLKVIDNKYYTTIYELKYYADEFPVLQNLWLTSEEAKNLVWKQETSAKRILLLQLNQLLTENNIDEALTLLKNVLQNERGEKVHFSNVLKELLYEFTTNYINKAFNKDVNVEQGGEVSKRSYYG